jgi:hypothetical protein
MVYKYAEKFGENKEKWGEFDKWLNEYADANREEFSKELYESERFQAVGTSSTHHAITFVPHPDMPEYIATAIRNKLLELWPPD